MPDKPKFTPAKIAKVLHDTKGMVYVAAQRLGCAPATIYNAINKYPTVKAAKESEEGVVLDAAELHVITAINNGEPWALQFVLKTKGKNRGYVERTESDNKTEITLRDYTIDIGKDEGTIDTPALRDDGAEDILE